MRILKFLIFNNLENFSNRFSILTLLFIFLTTISFGQIHPIIGKVIDEAGNPVASAKVSIEKGEYFETDLHGTFDLNPEKELEMPFEISVIKKGYKVAKFFFNDVTYELEIILTQQKNEVIEKEVVAQINSVDGNILSNHKIKIDGTNYTSNKNGEILITGNINQFSNVVMEGFELSKIVEQGQNFMIIMVPRIPDQIAQISLTPEQLNLKDFQKYKDYFNKLSEDLKAEKLRMDAINEKIKAELITITTRLKSETGLSKPQRQELANYAKKLEKDMSENTMAYQKSVQRTTVLIETLKNIIIENDSINIIADEKIQVAVHQNQITQKKSKRNLWIFSIIIGITFLFLLILYSLYIRLRKHRKNLLEMNKELVNVKNQLAYNVQELKESNEQLEIFVYKASHDIKGPLRSIIGLTNIGREDVKDPVALNYFDHILQSTKKLDKLLLDLLEVTKVKQATVILENINFKEMVKDSLASFNHLPDFDQMQFKINIQDNGKFLLDKKLLYSIIQNLIENPIKYSDSSKPESYLSIDIQASEKGATLKFSDNGLGIPQEYQSKVFDMFYKINEKSNGTGLGLYIVKTSVEKLKGKIRVESQEGIGTTFIVEFLNT